MMRSALRRLGMFGLALVTLHAVAADAAPPKRPNIVILLADDWGFTDVGSFGGEMATPNLDALAARGTRFANFHVTASCSPTRSILLTGVDNHRNGVGNMRESIPSEHYGQQGYLTVLNDRVVTVSSLLQDAGYRTYVAGKWHVGKEPRNLPDARGFTHSIIQGDSGSDNWETAKRYLDLTEKVYWFEDGREANMPSDYYSSQYYVDRMIGYLKDGKASGKPFFAYLPFQANHIPLQAPREFIDKYRGRYKDGWSALRRARRDKAAQLGLVPKDTPMVEMATTLDWNALTPEQKAYQERRMEVYAGMAEAMDYHVGRLVSWLKEQGEYDNTVFLFMSDNGAEASDPYAFAVGRLWLAAHYNSDIEKMGSKGAYGILGPSWASAAAAPLATYKFYAGEGGLRVPLIIAGVPGTAAGQIHQGFTHAIDIVPTLLELAGVQHPGTSYRGHEVEPLIGASLLPVMRGDRAAVRGAGQYVGYELSGNKALYKDDMKLVLNIAPVGDGLWHLYDMRKDPGETHDLAAAMPDVVRAMTADYEAWAKANGVLPMPPGYVPQEQILHNALVNVYWPRAQPWLAAMALALVALAVWRRHVRRLRRARAAAQ